MKKSFALIMIVAAAAPLLFSQGLQYDPPQIPGYEPPYHSGYRSPFTESSPSILRNESKFLQDTAVINFEKRQLTFSRTDSSGNTVWTYHYGELNDYITDKKAQSFYEDWYNKLTEAAKQELGTPPPPKLQWELAVHYPPWAQRLLGNEPPRLKIEGRLQLTAAYERTSVRVGKEEPTIDHIPLDFQTEYDFAIRGSVGRLITVNITHSKQDGFDLGDDPLKNFKVEYKESEPGELEDEIIQEIVAGYTGFDMPGTSLSGYSEKHDGLFGIKMRAKLGPLMLTAVASHAQGEALTMTLGGSNDPNSTIALRETEFVRNRYFFLDQVYRDFYNQFNNISQPDRNAARPPRITNFQAFVSIECQQTAATSTFRYMADIEGSDVCVIMLEENKDYIVDVDRGWVRFEHNVREDNIVAITMTTADPARVPNKGVIVPSTAPNNSRIDVSLLKPRNMEEMTNAHPLFGLMWRNVYHVSEVEDSKLDVFFLDPSVGDTIRHAAVSGRSVLISSILGITDEQGRARLENVEIFNLNRQELILPPWNPSSNGNEPFANANLGSMADTSIYRIGQATTFMRRDYVPKFGMVTGGSTRRTSYDNLGWNILPGTVTVKTNTGTVLIEDEDYELDYQMGIIDLLSTRARAADHLVITFQRESDFVLESKVFAGLRGEMKLPFISDNSFMAASVLYQNAVTSAEDVPQLGNEPFSKLHLSFNTSLDFEPEWMTKAVGLIPLVKPEGGSAAKVDFEIVHSNMNTNTSKDGNAYLDDFERTKDGYSLSLRHTQWHPSHYPFRYTGGVAGIERAMLESGRVPAWEFYWFTPSPYDDSRRVRRFDVWEKDPNNSRHNSSDSYIDVLRLHTTPMPNVGEIRDRFRKSYASITASFGRNGVNMENHRYLDMVINPKGAGFGGKGKLMIQIGTFSHDQVRDGGPPNGVFDLEDTTFQNRAELLPQFDKGLNRLDVADKFYVIPNGTGTGWDTLSRTQNTGWLASPRGIENPSGDRFQRYDRDNLSTPRFVNGTWGNSVYDTENIDGDGVPRVSITETYHSYTIDLDINDISAYIDTSARVMSNNGWRFYRIPLKDVLDRAGVVKDSSGGGADWSKVRGLRLVWFDFDEGTMRVENELHIASIELVGNYWEPRPGSESVVNASSISNYEDINYYNAVHGTIVRPKSGEVTPEERSLRLEFFDLGPGDTAFVRRNMSGYPQNISGYDSVSVKVYNNQGPFGEDLKFVLRFGSDDSTYYEYSAPLTVGMGWNHLGFSLQELSDLKMEAERDVPDNQPIIARRGMLRVVAPGGKRPNFTAIAYMTLGVTRGNGGPVAGEIWVNELIASGARNLTGVAARVNLSTQWADFLSLSVGANYTDGDFRTMTDAAVRSDSRSEFSGNVSATVNMNKFLPEEWGVLIPVGGSVSGSLTRPTVKPQSDIMLLNDNGNPDGFLDMAGDGLNLMFGGKPGGKVSRAQQFETFTSTRNIYTSFEKTTESENPLVNFTFDRIKTDVSYNVTTSYTARGDHPDSSHLFKTDTVETYAGNLRYDLSPRNPPEWTSVTLFDSVSWMPSIYRKYKFNLLPSTINLDLAEVQHRTEIRNDPKLNVHNFVSRSFDMRHGVRIEYTPIDPLLSLNYNARFERDLSDVPTKMDWDVTTDSTLPRIFGFSDNEDDLWDEYMVLYGERGRTQSVSAKLTPQFVSWMTHSAEYSANYSGQMVRRDNDSAQYLNASVGTSLRFRNSLMVIDFFKKLAPPSARPVGKAADKSDDTVAVGKSVMERMSDGVAKISLRTVNFEYDVTTDLKNNFLSSTYLADTMGFGNFEFFKYQLGMLRDFGSYFKADLGNDGLGYMRFREYSGVDHDLYRFDQSTGSWSARLSTSFSIPDPIRINFTNVSYGWGRQFMSQPDTAFIDTTIVLPEIRVSANTDILTKIALVKRHLSRLMMNSSMSYKTTRKESRERTDTTRVLEFQPLVSLDGKFHRWPALSTNYRYGRTSSTTVSASKGVNEGEEAGVLSTENMVRNGHTITASYEFTNTISRFQELKIGKWVFPIQGKTTIGMSINYDKTETRTHKNGDDDEEVREDSEFNYSPFVDYRFTDNIRGQARYLGTHKNQDGRRTNQQRFALSVEVVF